jgi:O-antigen/teichoic acid export membrane protein
VIGKAASLAFFATMARELGREGFGAFMFALALTGALLLTAAFGSDDLTAREVSLDRSTTERYLADVSSLKAGSLVAVLALAALVVNLGGFSYQTRLAVYIVGAGVAVELLAKTWYAILQGHQRMVLGSLPLVVQRTLTAAVGIAVLVLGGGLVAASLVFLGGALAGLVVAELCVRRVLEAPRPRPDPRSWPRILRRGFPIGVAGILFVLLLRSDVTLISFLSGESEVGIYAAAYRLVEGTQFIAWALAGAMLPWLARAELNAPGLGLARGYELGLKAINSLLIPLGMVSVLFASPLVRLLYGPKFAASVLPLRLLGLTAALYGIQFFASTTFIARNAAGTFVRILAAVVVFNLVGNVVAIPRYGAGGAAAVALASSAVLAGASVLLARPRAGNPRLARSFGGPLAGGAAVALVTLGLSRPPAAEIPLALAAYAATLAAVELNRFPDDAREYARALSLRPRIQQ